MLAFKRLHAHAHRCARAEDAIRAPDDGRPLSSKWRAFAVEPRILLLTHASCFPVLVPRATEKQKKQEKTDKQQILVTSLRPISTVPQCHTGCSLVGRVILITAVSVARGISMTLWMTGWLGIMLGSRLYFRVVGEVVDDTAQFEARPKSPKPASRSVQRALLTPKVFHGSLNRCGKSTL